MRKNFGNLAKSLVQQHAPNKACSRPPLARVGVRSNPCKRCGLRWSHSL